MKLAGTELVDQVEKFLVQRPGTEPVDQVEKFLVQLPGKEPVDQVEQFLVKLFHAELAEERRTRRINQRSPTRSLMPGIFF